MKTNYILFTFLASSMFGFSQISENTYYVPQAIELMPNQVLAAQDYFGSSSYITDALNPLNNNSKMGEPVDGSPLGFEGKDNTLIIHAKNDKYYKFQEGNYNGLNDKLVIELENGLFYEFNDSDIDFAMINNTKALKLKDKNNEMKYFFVLDQNEEFTILKRIKAKIIKGSISKMTKEKMENDRYFVYQDFYLLQNDKLEEIKLNNKTFRVLFKDNDKKMKNFIKDNNLSIKNEADFLKMLRYNKTL
ncbi:hypothetical protein [Bizionia myxarmorum]|uniref:Uncharacterized protein n=1 Tax=Bizionia myxarmorum TaxID=291186 RepID=A0A5D0REJ7_9FLAO|nr:hypothetical protein [Bizionia myxarmorum]TYB79376.1 hypothetical protein ES674_06275 [Bizionia myxarmorum]